MIINLVKMYLNEAHVTQTVRSGENIPHDPETAASWHVGITIPLFEKCE